MSDATIQVIVVSALAAIPATIAAAAAFWQSKLNAAKAAESLVITEDTNRKTQELIVAADTQAVETEKIHTLTNSNLTEVKANLAAAMLRIEKLQELVAHLADKGALTAGEAAQVGVVAEEKDTAPSSQV